MSTQRVLPVKFYLKKYSSVLGNDDVNQKLEKELSLCLMLVHKRQILFNVLCWEYMCHFTKELAKGNYEIFLIAKDKGSL